LNALRAASIALENSINSGFFYTRYPQKGEVPEGEEVYHRRVFYHALGAIPQTIRSCSGRNLHPKIGPGLIFPTTALAIDQRGAGLDQVRIVRSRPQRWERACSDHAGEKLPLWRAIYNGKIFITTN
jgi:hypothetical protein